MRARSMHKWRGLCPPRVSKCGARNGGARSNPASAPAWVWEPSAANAGAIPWRLRTGSYRRRQVEAAGIDEEPMHGDAGIAKVGELSCEMRPGVSGYGHDQVGGLRAVEKLHKPIDTAQDGDRIGLGMEGQMTASGPLAHGGVMTCVDEANNREPAPRLAAEIPHELASGAAGTHQHDPGLPECCPTSHQVIKIIHESPPLTRRPHGSRSCVCVGANCLGRGTYHPRPRSRRIRSSSSIDRSDVKTELFRKMVRFGCEPLSHLRSTA